MPGVTTWICPLSSQGSDIPWRLPADLIRTASTSSTVPPPNGPAHALLDRTTILAGSISYRTYILCERGLYYYWVRIRWRLRICYFSSYFDLLMHFQCGLFYLFHLFHLFHLSHLYRCVSSCIKWGDVPGAPPNSRKGHLIPH